MLLFLSWEHEGEIKLLLSYPLFTSSLSLPAFNIRYALSHTPPFLTLALPIFLIKLSYTNPHVRSALLLTPESCQSPLLILLKLLVSADLLSKAPFSGTASPSTSANLKHPFHSDPLWKPTSLIPLNFTRNLCLCYNFSSLVVESPVICYFVGCIGTMVCFLMYTVYMRGRLWC